MCPETPCPARTRAGPASAPTPAAVFSLYLRRLSRREVAERLEYSICLAKSYITEVYQIFELPPQEFENREERMARLQEVAQGEGVV
jgi:hypothetical protein